MFARAAEAGANKAGASGFSDLKGTMSGKAMGKELGLAAAQAASEKAAHKATMGGLDLEAQKTNIADRRQAMGQLTEAGSALGRYGTDVSGQNLERDIAGGRLDVEQRGQDIDVMKENQRGRGGPGEVADLLRASTEREIGGFEAGTERGKVKGDLGLRADELRRSGQIDAYREQTSRMDSLIKGAQAGNADAIAAYRAATERGEVTGDLSKDAADLKYRYDVLASDDAHKTEDRAVDLYGKEADAATRGYEAETDRISEILRGSGDLAGEARAGDTDRRQQDIALGQLANDVMSGKVDEQEIDKQIELASRQGDQQMRQRLIEMKVEIAHQKHMALLGQKAATIGAISSGLGQAAGLAVAASDREMKEDFSAVPQDEILAKAMRIPVQKWKYIGHRREHIGPMAQDVGQEFFNREGDKDIAIVDMFGILLASVQALTARVAALEGRA